MIDLHGQQPGAQSVHCSARCWSLRRPWPWRSSLRRARDLVSFASSRTLWTRTPGVIARSIQSWKYILLQSSFHRPLTKISSRSSSGISVSFAPWYLGMTSYLSGQSKSFRMISLLGSLGNDSGAPVVKSSRFKANSVGRCGEESTEQRRWIRTAWPRLRGWMSRNAKTLSLSKSLKEGISPAQMSVARLRMTCMGSSGCV